MSLSQLCRHQSNSFCCCCKEDALKATLLCRQICQSICLLEELLQSSQSRQTPCTILSWQSDWLCMWVTPTILTCSQLERLELVHHLNINYSASADCSVKLQLDSAWKWWNIDADLVCSELNIFFWFICWQVQLVNTNIY